MSKNNQWAMCPSCGYHGPDGGRDSVCPEGCWIELILTSPEAAKAMGGSVQKLLEEKRRAEVSRNNLEVALIKARGWLRLIEQQEHLMPSTSAGLWVCDKVEIDAALENK
jgi:hypothetical protein